MYGPAVPPPRHRSRMPMFALIPTLGSLFLAGCGGDDTGLVDPGGPGGGTPAPTPDFTKTLSAPSLSIVQGTSGQVTVTMVPTGGFSGSVTVTVEGLPAGVTASALTLGSGVLAGTLSLTAAASTPTGTSALTVRASAPGVQAKTSTLSLTVTAPPPQPDFGLSAGVDTVTVVAGEGASAPLTLTRSGGFTGAVTLSAQGLPQGATATFDPAAPTGSASTVTFATQAPTAGTPTPAGTYPITLTGSAQGLPNRTASVVLRVTAPAPPPPPPPSGNTTWEFCESSGLPSWVAIQDGNGPWTAVTGVGGQYAFQIDQANGGVAWVVPDGAGGFTLQVFFGARDELITYGVDRCDGRVGGGRTVTASVPGLGPTDVTVVTLGGVLPVSAPNLAEPNITFRGVPTGTVDLLGGRSALDLGTLQITPSRMYIQRGLNPADGGSVGAIDFMGANGFAPVVSGLTVTGAGGESIVTTTNYSTTNRTFGNLTVGVGGAGTSWYGVPDARREPGDLHILSVTAANLGAALQPSRTAVRMTAAAGPLSVALGAPLSTPTVQPLAGTGFARARTELPIQAEYNRFWIADFQQSGPGRIVTLHMTQAYRGSAVGTATLEIPEFAGVAGWNADWGLRPGSQVTWTATGLGWSVPGGIVSVPWADGNSYLSASRMGQFTP
jgi:hypothetical protein